MRKNIFEKVNPAHPDKLADRLGGFCVDLAYKITSNPHIAGEALLGHGQATVIIETDLPIFTDSSHISITSNCGFEDKFYRGKKWIKTHCKDKEKTVERLVNAMEDLDFCNSSEKLVDILWDTLEEYGENDFGEKNEGYHCWFILSIYLWIHENIPSIEKIDLKIVKQDLALNKNARLGKIGDNGIFKGVPTNTVEHDLTEAIEKFYKTFKSDGKGLILDETQPGNPHRREMEINQSMTEGREEEVKKIVKFVDSEISQYFRLNPLGNWTGGLDVDCGATNRKLGSDMGRAVTGGGLHFKDLSKADVSVNILCYLLAEKKKKEVIAKCVIGDFYVRFYINMGDGTYEELVMGFDNIKIICKEYIKAIGGFEKLAEWGLIRPLRFLDYELIPKIMTDERAKSYKTEDSNEVCKNCKT